MVLSVILSNVLPVLVTILTPVLVLIAHKLAQKLAAKLHLEALLAYEDKIDDLVKKGVQAAEQKALSALKSGTPTSGEQKLNEVMAFVMNEVEALGLPAKATEQLTTLVESKVFEMKAKA